MSADRELSIWEGNSDECGGCYYIRNISKRVYTYINWNVLIISSLLNFPDDLNNLTIIISHYHKDHYADLFAIKYAVLCYENLGLLKSNVNVYLPKIDKNEECFLDYNLKHKGKQNRLWTIFLGHESHL